MKIKILEVSKNELVPASIRRGVAEELPSLHDGWVFNFHKRIKELKKATAYVLVSEETPRIIEGALIFQLKDNIPYMAYIEIAPRNKGLGRKYDFIAGCLIAFAFRQSLELENPYKGILLFDVMEEEKDNEIKLMSIYSRKYGAQRLSDNTTMIIEFEQGKKLIEVYLDRRLPDNHNQQN